MTNQQVQFRFMDCKAEFDIVPGCYLPNTRLKSHRWCDVPKTYVLDWIYTSLDYEVH